MNYSIRRLALMKLAQGQPAPAAPQPAPAGKRRTIGEHIWNGLKFMGNAIGNRVSGRMGILLVDPGKGSNPQQSAQQPAQQPVPQPVQQPVPIQRPAAPVQKSAQMQAGVGQPEVDPYTSAMNRIKARPNWSATRHGNMIRAVSPDKREHWFTMDSGGKWTRAQTPPSQQFMNEFNGVRGYTTTPDGAVTSNPAAAKQRQAALQNMRARRNAGGGAPLRNGTGTMFFGGADMAAKFRSSPAYANLQRNFQRPTRTPVLQMARGPYALRGPGKPVSYTGLTPGSSRTSFRRG